MPAPILTFDRFIRAVEVTVDRGVVYALVSTPASLDLTQPKRYATIYWQMPNGGFMPPVCAVHAKLYRKPKHHLLQESAAVALLGIPTDLAQAIHFITYPYGGYSRSMRRMLLVACGLW